LTHQLDVVSICFPRSQKTDKYMVVQKSLRLTRFREPAEIAYQITGLYLDVLPFICSMPV
jgi:hypothetical protein